MNTAYCMEVVGRLRSRPKSNWIPYLLQIEPQPDRKENLRYSEDQLRQVRRYLKKGENGCKNVSLGKFPGKSRFTFVQYIFKDNIIIVLGRAPTKYK